MSKTHVSKIIGIFLVVALIISSNLAAGSAISASASNRQNPLLASSGLTNTNHAGAIQTIEPQYNWTAEALNSYADSSNTVEIIIGLNNSNAGKFNQIATLASQNGAEVVET